MLALLVLLGTLLLPTEPCAPLLRERPAPPGLGRFKASAAPARLPSIKMRISQQQALVRDDLVA